MQDLLAGRIDYLCTIAPTVISQIEGKTVKAMAILSRDRSPSLPALVPAHEQGLADFEASTWLAFFLPKGTPAPTVKKLHDATVAAMNIPAVQERLRTVGTDLAAPERRSPDYLQKFVMSEIEKWAAPIKAAGLTA